MAGEYTHTSASMTTVSGTVLAANSNRKYAFLQNIGGVDVFINVGGTAVASTGIRLDANGGFYELGGMWGNLNQRAITGITGSSTATVLVTEVT